jgi:glycine betaine/proline transport system substrate-binding protein|nr:glycine betaine ABC transporter substrate-binding protein [Lacticaseibacillus songhuajiangensis]
MMRKLIKWIASASLLLVLAGCSSKPAAYDSKQKLGPQVNYTITGIDAGAGIMSGTTKALSAYKLKAGKWQLQTSSTAAMTSTLGKAVEHKQPIVVTGWQPHWMFTKYNLKFLKDPKHVYGQTESIHTIARKGLQKDSPSAYTVLDRFQWTPADMSAVMLKVNGGMEPKKAAEQWLKQHPDKLKAWTQGVQPVKGKSITLTFVAWDSEIASTNVVAAALRSVGYKVTTRPMEIQPLWASVATGAADAMVCAWLPNTSGKYYADYKGQFVDLGANLHGARVGLAVPKYMTKINSIEDLLNK